MVAGLQILTSMTYPCAVQDGVSPSLYNRRLHLPIVSVGVATCFMTHLAMVVVSKAQDLTIHACTPMAFVVVARNIFILGFMAHVENPPVQILCLVGNPNFQSEISSFFHGKIEIS